MAEPRGAGVPGAHGAQSFVKQYGITYPSVRDTGGQLATAFGVRGVPETFFIDRQFRIFSIGQGQELGARGATKILGEVSRRVLVSSKSSSCSPPSRTGRDRGSPRRGRGVSTERRRRMMGCPMGSMFGMSWWMWLPGLLVVGALIATGVWTVARLAPRSAGSLHILEERFAWGEIGAEEFQRRRAVLEGSR